MTGFPRSGQFGAGSGAVFDPAPVQPVSSHVCAKTRCSGSIPSATPESLETGPGALPGFRASRGLEAARGRKSPFSKSATNNCSSLGADPCKCLNLNKCPKSHVYRMAIIRPTQKRPFLGVFRPDMTLSPPGAPIIRPFSLITPSIIMTYGELSLTVWVSIPVESRFSSNLAREEP